MHSFPQPPFQSVKNIQISWVPFRMENCNHLGTPIVKTSAGFPLPIEEMLKLSAGNQDPHSLAHIQPLIRVLNLGLGIP